MLIVVVLMVVFGFIEYFERCDFCHDGVAVYSSLIQVCYDALCGFLLVIIAIENSRTVLSAFVCSLTIEGRRIVHREENFEYLVQGCFGFVRRCSMEFCSQA